MQWAVAEAARLAQDGDTVLLAPAAASMDQFSSYAHRGAAFVAAVRARGGQGTTAKES
jgi:UDP-N-acetylmuramoylalanine--D-glutamate ligase